MTQPSMHSYINEKRAQGLLPITQPRMGFGDIATMQAGLQAVKAVSSSRIGTITVDAKTRQRRFSEASEALLTGAALNGFPIVSHGAEATRTMLRNLQVQDFPVQVRHGSPVPTEIFQVAAEAGITATEGGPVSYCLPYGRVPMGESMRAWDAAVRYWADAGAVRGVKNHLESFGGCMMGQLNPPDILLALSLLEARFFAERGIKSLSVSYAQGTNMAQDIGALVALRRLAAIYLQPKVDWHIVLYTWMGVFPKTPQGARRLIEDSGILATIGQAERIIVKTVVEAFQIPSIQDNVDALHWTAMSAAQAKGIQPNADAIEHADRIFTQARSIIDAVLNLNGSLSLAILEAFRKGVLDVPFCFHPDNKNVARASLDRKTGVIGWERIGRIPVSQSHSHTGTTTLTANSLLRYLNFNQSKYDGGFS